MTLAGGKGYAALGTLYRQGGPGWTLERGAAVFQLRDPECKLLGGQGRAAAALGLC